MWKRLSTQKGPRQPLGGGSGQSETLLEGHEYGGGLGININRAQSPPDRGRPPPRPPRDDPPKGLPKLPL